MEENIAKVLEWLQHELGDEEVSEENQNKNPKLIQGLGKQLKLLARLQGKKPKHRINDLSAENAALGDSLAKMTEVKVDKSFTEYTKKNGELVPIDNLIN